MKFFYAVAATAALFPIVSCDSKKPELPDPIQLKLSVYEKTGFKGPENEIKFEFRDCEPDPNEKPPTCIAETERAQKVYEAFVKKRNSCYKSEKCGDNDDKCMSSCVKKAKKETGLDAADRKRDKCMRKCRKKHMEKRLDKPLKFKSVKFRADAPGDKTVFCYATSYSSPDCDGESDYTSTGMTFWNWKSGPGTINTDTGRSIKDLNNVKNEKTRCIEFGCSRPYKPKPKNEQKSKPKPKPEEGEEEEKSGGDSWHCFLPFAC